MILFDLEKGSSSYIDSKCYIEPKTRLTSEGMEGRSLIEVICEEKPLCKKGKCFEPFDITTEITYEPFNIFKG